jgi:endonuclease/exonuclease/phosphatase family metal-dependent hydrolase
LAVEGYDMFRVDRIGNKGGGMLLYVREELNAVPLDVSSSFREQVWCSVVLKSSTLLIGLIYRSPSSEAANNEMLLETLERAVNVKGSQSRHLLVMGDFNYPA